MQINRMHMSRRAETEKSPLSKQPWPMLFNDRGHKSKFTAAKICNRLHVLTPLLKVKSQPYNLLHIRVQSALELETVKACILQRTADVINGRLKQVCLFNVAL